MIFQQIRNATVRLQYNGVQFLIDPWLSPKGAMGKFKDIPEFTVAYPEHDDIAMPRCGLPMSVEEVLAGVDAYLLTHLHPDHFDLDMTTGTGGAMLHKDTPIFVQNQEEVAFMKQSGFTSAHVFAEAHFEGITITSIQAVHGTEKPCGDAKGLIFQSSNEPTVYFAGDTVWCSEVEEALRTYQPDIIVLNACAATLQDYGRLITNDQEVLQFHEACPQAKLIISHMDVVAHATINRQQMAQFVKDHGIEACVSIPQDGETLSFIK